MLGYIVLELLGPGHAHGTNASLQGDVRTLKEVNQRGWGRCKIVIHMLYYTTYATPISVLISTIVMVLIKIHCIFKVISIHLTVQNRLVRHMDTPIHTAPPHTCLYVCV